MKKLKRTLLKPFVYFLLTQVFISGIWASAHLTEDARDSHDVPHSHHFSYSHFKDVHGFDSTKFKFGKFEQDSLDNAQVFEQHSKSHESDKHVHVHLHIVILTSEQIVSGSPSRFEPTQLEYSLRSLTYSPPVPPPTA